MIIDRGRRFPVARYATLEATKADEYDYWRRRPDHERIKAVSEITSEAYGLKDIGAEISGLRTTLIRVKR